MSGGGGSTPFGPVGPNPQQWGQQVAGNSAARTQAAYSDLGMSSQGPGSPEQTDIQAGNTRAQLGAGQLGLAEDQAALQQQQQYQQIKGQQATGLGGLAGAFSGGGGGGGGTTLF
jgi:hypothetical protein